MCCWIIATELYKPEYSNVLYLLSLFILGIGFGMFSSPNTNVIMGSVEKKVYGTTSAMVATMRSTCMMFSMSIAALTIHWFLGKAQININNIDQFIMSTKVVFTTFTVLCLFGVYTSIVKNKKA